MASYLGSIFGFEFGAKIYLFWRLWQVIPDWLVLDATGCEQSELLLLCCGSTSMIPAASLWNKSLATGCSMMVYPWVPSRRCSGTDWLPSVGRDRDLRAEWVVSALLGSSSMIPGSFGKIWQRYFQVLRLTCVGRDRMRAECALL